ncbi:MAG: sodium:solute symporter [Phycisphaerales bacterium]|nr:sodium:solute symporter [Phycisphaerales bacterium]
MDTKAELMPDASITPASGLGVTDLLVIAVYIVTVIAIGVVSRRPHPSRDDEFLLAGRSMPFWAVAISILATMQSAATFVGGPQESFDGTLSYLTVNIATILAVIIICIGFLPAFYRAKVTSVYELLGARFGSDAQRCGSAMFLLGRLLASGPRLFILAIPFSLFVFDSIQPRAMTLSILLIAAVAVTYTLVGGIRAVIWTDVLQAVVYISAVLAALAILYSRIPGDAESVIDTLRTADKLRLIEWNPAHAYSIWGVVTGWTLFMVAALGTDQDLTQRMLTCRSPREGIKSLILSTIISWPVVLIFLIIGSLLFVYYGQTAVAGETVPRFTGEDTRYVFIEFIRHEIPVGLRGLMLAGLFAASMSSLDSALNAMASVVVADFYRPWRRSRGTRGPIAREREVGVARTTIVIFGALLATVACICVDAYDPANDSLISFALGIMMYAYGGLAGVFIAAIFTNRGNNQTALAGMLAGLITVVILRPTLWMPIIFRNTAPPFEPFAVALPWQMTIASAVSFGICISGRRPIGRRTRDRDVA